jgi:GntR family transcriptional regulator/MocR family aminotransferase
MVKIARPVSAAELPLSLAEDGARFVAIARALSDEIRRGRLAPGARLPGSRSLARQFGVNRNTVLAALAELGDEGWITTRPASGTFVSSELPEHRPRAFSRAVRDAAQSGFALRGTVQAAPEASEACLNLGGGIPDLRQVPSVALARAYRRVLRLHPSLLDYGDPRGERTLRRILAEHLAKARGIALGEDDLLITRGSQMALDLTARTLFAPGDTIAVEALGYRPAWRALQASGLRVVPVRVDARGIDVDALEQLCTGPQRLRGVYVTPHHQYPTTATLSAPRRLALLSLARRHGFAILEDDYDHEFHYDGRPVLPLASADDAGVVVYFGTLSKILAPGLRIGYVAAPRPVLTALTGARYYVDRQGDPALERAVAELFDDGEVMRHARRMQRVYRARRDGMVEDLRRDFADVLSFDVPAGGMALWARVAKSIDVDAWCAAAKARGVILYSARRYAFSPKRPGHVRVGYATVNDEERARALRILRACLPCP